MSSHIYFFTLLCRWIQSTAQLSQAQRFWVPPHRTLTPSFWLEVKKQQILSKRQHSIFFSGHAWQHLETSEYSVLIINIMILFHIRRIWQFLEYGRWLLKSVGLPPWCLCVFVVYTYWWTWGWRSGLQLPALLYGQGSVCPQQPGSRHRGYPEQNTGRVKTDATNIFIAAYTHAHAQMSVYSHAHTHLFP